MEEWPTKSGIIAHGKGNLPVQLPMSFDNAIHLLMCWTGRVELDAVTTELIYKFCRDQL